MQDDASGEGLAFAGAVTGGVELFGGFGVGVLVEEPVKQVEGVGFGLAGLPCHGRDGCGEAGGLSASEPHVEVDVVVLEEGDVVEE